MATRKMGIMPNSWDKSVKIVFENNYFGDNDGIYNLMELNCSLADGSSISGNTFSEHSCTHNHINVYQVDDNATININNNVFAHSANGIRIGCKGAPKGVTINITGNRYDSTDTSDDGAWAGLFFIQPYGKQTTDMSGITINVSGNVNNSGIEQLFYYYAGVNDAQLVADRKLPVVKINGEAVSFEDYPIDPSTKARELPTPTEEEPVVEPEPEPDPEPVVDPDPEVTPLG